MNSIEIPKCFFTQYYGFSAKINTIVDYLELVDKKREFPFQKTGNKKTDFDYANNMKQLGLINLRDNFYYLTPRGQSILIIRRVVDKKHIWKEKLIKFFILKALSDLDWDCITTLIWYSQILKLDSNTLRSMFKPSFSEKNFKDHWLRLHSNLLKNTDLLDNYLKLYNDFIKIGEEKKNAHKKASLKIDPYYKDFIGNSYFDVNYEIFDNEAKNFVKIFLTESLKIYKQYLDNKEIGNFEPLKSLLMAYSLRDNKYISEIELSKALLEIFLENRIPIYKVLLDLQYSGRGIFYYKNNSFEYYPDFNLYIALQKMT